MKKIKEDILVKNFQHFSMSAKTEAFTTLTSFHLIGYISEMAIEDFVNDAFEFLSSPASMAFLNGLILTDIFAVPDIARYIPIGCSDEIKFQGLGHYAGSYIAMSMIWSILEADEDKKALLERIAGGFKPNDTASKIKLVKEEFSKRQKRENELNGTKGILKFPTIIGGGRNPEEIVPTRFHSRRYSLIRRVEKPHAVLIHNNDLYPVKNYKHFKCWITLEFGVSENLEGDDVPNTFASVFDGVAKMAGFFAKNLPLNGRIFISGGPVPKTHEIDESFLVLRKKNPRGIEPPLKGKKGRKQKASDPK